MASLIQSVVAAITRRHSACPALAWRALRLQSTGMTLRMLFRLWPVLIGLMLAAPAMAAERDPLADALALPVASGLAGARDLPRFAWIEYRAGLRNIWVATRGQPARRWTAYSADDGQQISGLAFSNDGASLAFVRGGDDEFPDQERLPNT